MRRSLPIRCASCGEELLVSDDIQSLICGCCLEAVDLDAARAETRLKEPSEFIVKNGVLKGYYGAQSYDIHIPFGVKKIASYVFGYGVCGVIVPEGVEEIEGGAFLGASLEYLELPDSIKRFGSIKTESSPEYYAFDFEEMANAPVKPIVKCSSKIKRLLLEGVRQESRDIAERSIEWR